MTSFVFVLGVGLLTILALSGMGSSDRVAPAVCAVGIVLMVLARLCGWEVTP